MLCSSISFHSRSCNYTPDNSSHIMCILCLSVFIQNLLSVNGLSQFVEWTCPSCPDMHERVSALPGQHLWSCSVMRGGSARRCVSFGVAPAGQRMWSLVWCQQACLSVSVGSHEDWPLWSLTCTHTKLFPHTSVIMEAIQTIKDAHSESTYSDSRTRTFSKLSRMLQHGKTYSADHMRWSLES